MFTPHHDLGCHRMSILSPGMGSAHMRSIRGQYYGHVIILKSQPIRGQYCGHMIALDLLVSMHGLVIIFRCSDEVRDGGAGDK